MHKKTILILSLSAIICLHCPTFWVFAQPREFERLRSSLFSEGVSLTSAGKIITTDYFIAVGDVLEVFVWQNPDLSKDIIVGPDGKIAIPLAGRIKASGFTAAALEEEIRKRLTRYIKHPQVSIMIKKISGNKIIILGEINYPGIYAYQGTINLIDLIALAGDFTERAREDSVMVVRAYSPERRADLQIALKRRKGIRNEIRLLQTLVEEIQKENKNLSERIVNKESERQVDEQLRKIENIESYIQELREESNYNKEKITEIQLASRRKEVVRINLARVIRKGIAEQDITLRPNDVVYVPKSFIANFNKFWSNLAPTVDETTNWLLLRREIRRVGGHDR